jgi:peroxiredoxin
MEEIIIKDLITNNGESVFDLSADKSVMLIFLRHFGCIFCKEALFDISKKSRDLEQKGVKIVFVHMAEDEVAEKYFLTFGLKDVSHISDPTCALYQKFGLTKGTTSQLLGLKNWVRGFEVSVGKGIEVSIRQIGDAFQMPGVFVINYGKIKSKYIHTTAADKPDYEKLLACCEV